MADQRIWYTDPSAEIFYRILRDELAPIVGKLCPNMELSHLGIRRNEHTEEVILKLHLNQIGRIIVRGGTADADLLKIEESRHAN